MRNLDIAAFLAGAAMAGLTSRAAMHPAKSSDETDSVFM